MTRICLITEGHKFAVISDGALWAVHSFGYFYEHGLRVPDDADIVKDMQELEEKFLLSGIGKKSRNSATLPPDEIRVWCEKPMYLTRCHGKHGVDLHISLKPVKAMNVTYADD